MISERKVSEEYRRAFQNLDVARRYDNEMSSKSPSHPHSLRNLIGRVVSWVEQKALADLMSRLPPGGMIFDVPCGSGKELPALRGRGRVIGADSSMPMLRFYAQRGGLESLCADISSLPLKDQSVDVIVCNRL